MPNRFFSLRTYCALRARECDGRSKDGANARQILLFTHILRPLGALCCFDLWCSFFAARQRTNQENVQGALPLDPAPPWASQPFAPSVGNFVSQGGAQRFGATRFRGGVLKKPTNTLGGTLAVLMAKKSNNCRTKLLGEGAQFNLDASFAKGR